MPESGKLVGLFAVAGLLFSLLLSSQQVASLTNHKAMTFEATPWPEGDQLFFHWPLLNKQPTELVSDAGEAWLWPEDEI